jgi:cell division initiation protein
MLTASDILNVKFSKTMGGYRTYEVDEFREKCAETVSELTSAKMELEKKLEILADKLVEYRKDEDNIRTALLSAQKLGDTVVREAKHKAERILEDAKNKAEKMLENTRKGMEEEERELERVKREVTNFKARLLSIYKEHLSLIDILPEIKEQEPEQNQEEKPKEEQEKPEKKAKTEQKRQQPEAKPAKSLKDAEPTQEIPEVVLDIPQIENEDKKPAQESESTAGAKPTTKFADLKFGDDYDISMEVSEENTGFFRRRK